LEHLLAIVLGTQNKEAVIALVVVVMTNWQ
jgi:hypothetical protein